MSSKIQCVVKYFCGCLVTIFPFLLFWLAFLQDDCHQTACLQGFLFSWPADLQYKDGLQDTQNVSFSFIQRISFKIRAWWFSSFWRFCVFGVDNIGLSIHLMYLSMHPSSLDSAQISHYMITKICHLWFELW